MLSRIRASRARAAASQRVHATRRARDATPSRGPSHAAPSRAPTPSPRAPTPRLHLLELRRSLRLTLHRYRVELLLAARSLHPLRLRLQGLHTLTLQSLARRRVAYPPQQCRAADRCRYRLRAQAPHPPRRLTTSLRPQHPPCSYGGSRSPLPALRRALESLSPPGRSAVRTICIYIVPHALSRSDRVRNGRSNRVGTLLGRRNRERSIESARMKTESLCTVS